MTKTACDMNGDDVKVGDRVMVDCEVVAINSGHITVSNIDHESGLPMVVSAWLVTSGDILKTDSGDD